jgi:excisionase family DNA binding protein
MKNLFSVAEAASYLKMPLHSLYKLTSKRLVPFYKPGKRILFDASELDEWLSKSHKKVSTASLENNKLNNSKIKNV